MYLAGSALKGGKLCPYRSPASQPLVPGFRFSSHRASLVHIYSEQVGDGYRDCSCGLWNLRLYSTGPLEIPYVTATFFLFGYGAGVPAVCFGLSCRDGPVCLDDSFSIIQGETDGPLCDRSTVPWDRFHGRSCKYRSRHHRK